MISDDMFIKSYLAFKYRMAMVTRILFRYKTTPRFRMFRQMTSQISCYCSFITTVFTLIYFRRSRCYKFFMISENVVIKRYFPIKYRMAMVTRVLFRCKTTPRFKMFRQMTSKISYCCSFITTMFTLMDFRRY
ncbi:unnamed protein product [Callosobruchus maculatus]|uniref:Uncharacterized protein n=1 Tax=Callosobruchus maculatus TaxID=64391 RepID=A0A653CKB2_CALMS|nr:unnamed protein product [Callosobruchus maculatus]